MKTTALSLRSAALRTLTALAALSPAIMGCIGAEPAPDEAADSADAALNTAGTRHLTSAHSGLAADVSGWSKDNGAKVQQWQYGHQANQQWTLKSASGGAFTIVSVNSGKCLDVTGASTADGAAVQQWSCHGGANQRWTLKDAGSGAVTLVGVGSGKCLDVKDASATNGAALQIWSCHGGDNQRWLLDEDTTSGGTPSGGGKTEYAPYFETWAWGGSSPFGSLMQLKNKAGLNGATLAFVLADGSCKATRDIQDNLGDVNAFRSAGGLVKASFGGASGDYLDAKCGSAGALAGAIGAFIDETGITDLDFDVEQGPVMTTSMNKKRGQALKQLQDQRQVKVSFTLPVDPSGLPDNALDVVRQAVNAGVSVSHVNLMVMDYGISGSMGGYAKQSLNGTHAQLLGVVPGLDDAGAWRMLGATPMIGQNDSQNEVFTLGDAQSLLGFAQQKGLGLVSFWAIQRDQPGSDYNEATTVNSKNFQFHDVFKALQ
jgi:chitinase